MADPVSATLIAAAAATGAVGQVHAAKAEASAAKYNAKMAEHNQVLAKQKAAEDERLQRIHARKQMGSMRAAFGSSGVTIEGSPLDVLEESAATAELDALKIRHQGETQAWAYGAEARLERFRAKTAKTAGYLGAASSLLSGGGKMAAMGG